MECFIYIYKLYKSLNLNCDIILNCASTVDYEPLNRRIFDGNRYVGQQLQKIWFEVTAEDILTRGEVIGESEDELKKLVWLVESEDGYELYNDYDDSDEDDDKLYKDSDDSDEDYDKLFNDSEDSDDLDDN